MVAEVHWLAIHERAPPDNALDTPDLTFPDRCVGHTPFAKGAVEPDLVDLTFAALTHQLDRQVGVGGDHDAVNEAGNGSEVGITTCTFDHRGIWIDREYLIPGVA